MIDVLRCVTESGKDVVGDWLKNLHDNRTRAKIAVRINRLAAGTFGDCKPLRDGVWELRIDWGLGYRVYYAKTGRTAVLLRCGGDKRKQSADQNRAVGYWIDYQRRMEKS
jgi:putative addiction module killer protein